MTYYTRGYSPQPTQRVGSAELKAEFQAIEDGLNAAEAQDGKSVRAPEAIPVLPNAISRASKVLAFDASGNPVAQIDVSALTVIAQIANQLVSGPVLSVNGRFGVVTGLQELLQSGTTIKTINNIPLLGSGDITISSGLTLIASLNATAVSALDFLSVFTSAYDDYVIEIKGLRPSAADYPIFRVANGGTVDAGANYWAFSGPLGSVSSASNFLYLTHLTQGTDAAGCTGIIRVRNVNSSTQMRSIDTQIFSRDSGTSAVRSSMWVAGYVAASTISGFRILWSGGATFQAQGNVRVYGVAK